MEKVSKSFVKIITLLFVLMFLCGCGKAANDKTVKENDDDDTIQIGMSFDSFVIERWERDRDVFVSQAKEQGAEVLVQVADGNLEEQKEQIKYLINKGVDALVIIAVDCNELTDEVKMAKDAGIYVISYDRMILNSDIDLLVSFDNKKVGQLMAEAMVDKVRFGGRIVCINGSELDNNVSEVCEGFNEEISKSSLKVVYNDYCPNWEAEHAYEIMQKLLDDKLSFDAIMCGNDDIASMVYKALSERGKTGNVVMVGQDADLAACQRVVSGWQDMTVYKSVESLAKVAANETINLIKTGETSATSSVNNGKEDVACILLEPIAVNEKNMQEIIIDGGFHLYDEVYGK